MSSSSAEVSVSRDSSPSNSLVLCSVVPSSCSSALLFDKTTLAGKQVSVVIAEDPPEEVWTQRPDEPSSGSSDDNKSSSFDEVGESPESPFVESLTTLPGGAGYLKGVNEAGECVFTVMAHRRYELSATYSAGETIHVATMVNGRLRREDRRG